MCKIQIDLLQEWDTELAGNKISLRIPVPTNARGFLPYGFVRKNDSAEDFVDWYGLSMTFLRATDGADMVSVTAFFADQKPLTANQTVLFQNGKARVDIPFSLFPIETVKGNRWEFVTGFQIEVPNANATLAECWAKRRPSIYVSMPIKGKSGEPGEQIVYQGTAYNCDAEPITLSAEQVFEGWESLIAEIHLSGKSREDPLVLAPGECVDFTVAVTVHDGMTPGGYENTVIRMRGQNSQSDSQEMVTLNTMRVLPHPYLYHTADIWHRVRENIDRYEPYQAPYRAYLEKANGWAVTDPMEDRPFCYETQIEDCVMSTAYAFVLTEDKAYAEKLADFYRRFSDPLNGYPAKKRGCSHSYVQEGHFFKHLAVGYDMICDAGVLSAADKQAVEQCFRLYMEMLDVHILDGRISNWILSELQGALFCALVLQDMERALRFTFGTGGIVEQFRHGIFSDGWWHECSVGYNTWVSSIMLHTAHALCLFGIDLVHARFPLPFNKEVSATFRNEAPIVRSGMYNQKWGGMSKSYACIKDMFDAPLPFLDDRGILFGIADSDEKRLSNVHNGSTYDLAYDYYQDDRYLFLIEKNDPDPIFGDPEAHARAVQLDGTFSFNNKNAFSNNIGLALLRSQTPGRTQREQIQAVLRYGSHGNAHGHFDIANLLSVMRYGRSFYNPENCWWGYAHFMYKFYVQCSLTKNMVVVDEKMQVPADSTLILWHSEDGLQAAGVQVRTKWSYPPYGGMVYEQDGQTNTKDELRKRCKMNRCWLPIAEGEGTPTYGEMTGFTEPILQKRIMAVTDDYIVLFDYLEGEREHQYDSLMQIKGFMGIEGGSVAWKGHTEQMNANPISDAQFITDCSWYQVQGTSTAKFRTVFTEEHAGERMICDRSNYNEPGTLHMDIHTAWPKQTEQMVGRVAVYDGWAADGDGYAIPLAYRLEADGKQVDAGAFDGWILGRGEISADVRNISSVSLFLKQGNSQNELGNPVPTPQGVFWGDICLELENGDLLRIGKRLSKQPNWPHIHFENVDTSCGIGRDYKGGRVTIVGTEYPYALGASPIDHGQESRITLDLSSLGAVRLTACVGVDAFPGDEWQKRKTYSVRTQGTVGRYVTVVEPYECEPAVAQVEADDPDSVRIILKDGRVQTIRLTNMQGDRPSISLTTSQLNKEAEVK